MSEHVTKWVAGWDYSDELIVISVDFRKTKKLLIRETGTGDRKFRMACGYCSRFDHNDPRLHDTREAALDRLIQVEEKQIRTIEKKLETAQSRLEIVTSVRRKAG